LPPAGRAALLRTLAERFPNVTTIDVTALLGTLADLLSRLAAGLAGVGALALVSGALVMAGAVAATQGQRVADAVVLKTLGATSWQIRAAWAVEFAALGLVAGLLALAAGAAGSWAVLRFVLRAEWHFSPVPALLTVAGAWLAALLLGLGTSEPALREPPARRLRNA
jgi:putative ABC transport system permease protein